MKSLIITTINPYDNTSIDKYSSTGYDIIIVGDLKTPHSTYQNKNIKYIHPDEKIFENFSKMLPYNHYCRKNIGYLYAISKKSDTIFDTDDDNYPLNNFNTWKNVINIKTVVGPKYPNIMSLFTKKNIWARGFPLEKIQKRETIELKDTNDDISKIGIYQSLAEGDPDVDAIYRLTNENYNSDIVFDNNKGFILNKNIYVQGNTQATIWCDKSLFHLLYIPCTVSFRFCDILKMYIAQKCMWEYDKLFCYISPIVRQDRNDHDFMTDFKSEYSMYTSTFKIIDKLFSEISLCGNENDLVIIYKKLLEYGIVKEIELNLVQEWITLILDMKKY